MQNLLLASWVPKTLTNCNSYIRKWVEYCPKEGISGPYIASCDQAISFLSNTFYEEKENYCTIAVAGAALSNILPKINGQTFGKDDRVSKMKKEILKLRLSSKNM